MYLFQFLIGTVQPVETKAAVLSARRVSIPHRYGTTTEYSAFVGYASHKLSIKHIKKSVNLFFQNPHISHKMSILENMKK